MSDFDPKDIIKSDFDPADVVQEHTESEPISKMESFGKGIQEGGTLGFADELQGGVEASADKVHQFLNALGLTGPSVSQVNEQTNAPGPKSTLDLYREARDKSRQEMAAAQQANPGSFLGGAVAGGVATIPALPGKVVAPLGQAAEGAGWLARMGKAAANAAPLSAVASAGGSNSDVLSDPGQVAKDVALGTPVGMGTAGVIQGAVIDPVIAGANLAGKAVPNVIKTAFNRGRQGIDTTGDEFYNATNKGVNDVVNEVSLPILEQSQKQVSEHANKMVNLDEQINVLKNQQAESLKLGQARNVAQNAKDIQAINQKTVQAAKNTQKYLGDVKKTLGSAFDDIDTAAQATGINPDMGPAMDGLQDTLWHQSGLPEGEIQSIVKKMWSTIDNKDGVQGFKNFKQVLSNYFEHANPVVRRAAKQAYGRLKNDYAQALEQGGYGQIAQDMAETNKRWGALSELQEEFVDNLNRNRITNEIQASPDTINAMANFAGKDPKQLAKSEYMSNLMNTADPQGAKPVLNQLSALADETAAVKAGPEELQQLPNPELERLQALLNQTKKVDSAPIPGVDLPMDEIGMKKNLTNLLPKQGMNSGNDNAENTLSGIFDFLKSSKGSEYVDGLKSRLKPLNEDVALRNAQGGLTEGVPLSGRDLLTRSLGGTTKVANIAGRTAKSVSDTANKVNEFVSKDILHRGVQQISDYTPQEMTQLATRFSSSGTMEGEAFARVLESAKGKNNISKNAIIFGLMQQPSFREMLHGIYKQEVRSNGEDGR